ncbi:MAG: hypothetical protein AB1516_15100 [Pseudomonadota bacterium]
MNGSSESLENLLLSGIMGILGGFITTPVNTIFAWLLKREEQSYQYKLDIALKKYELLLKHKLEKEQRQR